MDGRRRPRLLGRSAHDLGDEPGAEREFVGGVRRGSWNATWPLARLFLFSKGFRIEASFRVLPVPTWEARYDELTAVQAVGKIPLFSTGVCFRAGDAKDWIVFWTMERPTVMEAFASRGVVVSTKPTRLGYRMWFGGEPR